MGSIRPVLNELDRRIMPYTSYRFSSSNSARYDPSWPVIPVISALFTRLLLLIVWEVAELCLHHAFLSTCDRVLIVSRSTNDRSRQRGSGLFLRGTVAPH